MLYNLGRKSIDLTSNSPFSHCSKVLVTYKALFSPGSIPVV